MSDFQNDAEALPITGGASAQLQGPAVPVDVMISALSQILSGASPAVDLLDLVISAADAYTGPDYDQVMLSFDLCPVHRCDAEICADDELDCQVGQEFTDARQADDATDALCPGCGNDIDECLDCRECDEHGWVTVTADHSGPGFAGGLIVHIELSCGCIWHDESDDVRAAR